MTRGAYHESRLDDGGHVDLPPRSMLSYRDVTSRNPAPTRLRGRNSMNRGRELEACDHQRQAGLAILACRCGEHCRGWASEANPPDYGVIEPGVSS